MIRLSSSLIFALVLAFNFVPFVGGARAQRLEICAHVPRRGWVSVEEI